MNRALPPDPVSESERTMTGGSGMTRRRFLRQAGTCALSWAAWSHNDMALPGALPNPVGYSNISWRPEEFGQALETVSALGFQGMQLLDWVQEVYSSAKAPELEDRLQKLMLSAPALSCGKVKLHPDGPENFTTRFRQYADFLHNLRGNVL